jgi:hypothetical protein
MNGTALFRAFCATTFLVSGTTCGTAQYPESTKAVPDAFKISFREVLARAVADQRAQDWKALYGLQWQEAIEHESIARFVASRKEREWILLAFSVTLIDSDTSISSDNSDGSWTVIGCSRVLEDNKEKNWNSSIRVYRVGGMWFASEVRPVVPMDGGRNWTSCKFKDGVLPDRLWNAAPGPS